MIKIFDQWYHDKETRIIVDPFSIIIGNILTETIDCCDFRRSCHSEIISIGPEGNVYPCGQFNGLEEYCFGNIYNQSFNDIMETSMMKKLLMRVPENIKKCNLCKYKIICNCGCTVSALIERGNIMDPDYYCTGRKMIFQHIIDTLENDLDRATELKSIREPKIGNYVI